MNISSSVHKQPGKVQLLILDVVAGNKPFLAGVLIGDLRADPPTTSELGNECLRRLTATQDLSSNNDKVHIVEVRGPDRAQKQIAKVCTSVDRHDAVAFFCIDERTYEAVCNALKLKI